MKVLQINTVYGEGSTGKIAKGIHDLCIKNDIDCLSAFRCKGKSGFAYEDSIEISSPLDSKIHGVFSRFTMFKGCLSYFKTRRFLRKVKSYSPDVIHLHNLHGSYINLPLLFKYVKKNQIPVVWTFHDCWPFTAICSHFSIAGCDKWINGCHNCPQKKKFSSSPIDFTQSVYRLKKKWFSGIDDLTIVTPSDWLGGVVKKSFFKNCKVKTIYNGIDLSIFTPTASEFRSKYNLQNKKIILGVSFGWSHSKGLDVFVELRNRLSDEYAIVLVGTDSSVDATLPDGIISINRTNNQKELAEIYSAADVLVNPTREEVLGLVNIESLACGTPVVTFNAGGSPECIDKTCGVVVDTNDTDALLAEVIRVCNQHPFSSADCINRAKLFDKNERLEEYINLYRGKV